ncbi:hypothetical protein EG68_05162 [Paragonimus skrjabini miyazakii]|uniref:U3 small nucleolar RNA-associated protein 13 C-terminal domain-containing protein n=1 Tax=Paragonimus skrjabini miyazakii TaxID=59628 RepID=A0A8S9Z1I3_9TREM|nr:hypothetical protein EG68_05162 [Paragonimus skrjabini miyazakii]
MMKLNKAKFRLGDKFAPYFSSQYPIFLTEGRSLFCGRNVDDSVQITALDTETFTQICKLTDDDKITCFVVNLRDSTIFIALKNLLIKKVEFPSLKVVKVWRSCHQRPIVKMAVNRNGTRLATGSGDTVIRLWHLGPKEGYSASCRSHNSMATLLSFHPDQPYFFSSALGDYNVLVWNAETGAKMGSLEGHQSTVTGISFNCSGSSIATCGRDKVIIIWSCPEFERINLIPAFESMEACIFLPTGSLVNHLGDSVLSDELLITGGQWGCLRVWHPISGRCLLEIKGPLDRSPLPHADVQVNRESIVYGLHSILDLQVVWVCTGSSHESGSQSIPKLVLVRQSNHVEFYDPVIGKLSKEFLGDIGQVDQLGIVGKSHNRLVLADASHHLKLFTNPCGLANSEQSGSWNCHLVPGGHTDVITDLTVSSCGEWIASGSKDQSICLWHVVERDFASQTNKGPDVQVVLGLRLSPAHGAHISALCFNKLTTLLVSASEDMVLKAWTVDVFRTDNNSPQSPSNCGPKLSEWSVMHAAHKASVNDIDVSVNNQLVATASRDKTLKIWKVAKHGLECVGVLQGHRRGVWSVRFSSREKVVLSASGDGDIKLWNLKDFSCIRTFEGHAQPVYKAVFISNDRQILSCDQKGLVRLWDVSKPTGGSSGIESTDDSVTSRVFEAHEGRIWSLVLTPDESGFFTGGEDETLCYFQDVTQQMLEERAKKQEDFIQTRQRLDNLIEQKQFAAALRLSVQLDQPKRALDLLENLIFADDDDVAVPKCPRRRAPVVDRIVPALNGLLVKQSDTNDGTSNEFLVQRLLTYLCVLNWLLTSWTPDQLIQWPSFARTVESLLPYTTRHYQRISRLEEQLAVLDYLCELANEHQVLESFDSSFKGGAAANGLEPNVVDLNLSMEVIESID